jgi:alginate O-acetyltransferase complex protein AlgI
MATFCPVLFPTVEFAAFFCVVLILNWALMPYPRWWKPFIIAASYLCYGWASWHLVLVLVGVTLFNQAGAQVVHRAAERWRKPALMFFVAGNVGVLVYAKYTGFFAREINGLLELVGLAAPLPVIAIGATVGISFYTFQGISYVVDVYRGVLPPAKTIDFVAYQAFFPHLFAGPIVRASELLPQLQKPRDPKDLAVVPAFALIFSGLVKKLLIADVLGKLLVDPVYESPGGHSAAETWLALYGYAAQIYGDFSGYTDMAIGIALLLGYRFPVNFNRPYAAVTLQDFWRRWHISLSSWLRDYLYIPLGGGRSHVYRNLMATMLLGGLWHGSNWTFVAWGGIHGGVLASERLLTGRTRVGLPAWARWLVTFHVVCLAWVFFRAPNFSTAMSVLGGLVPHGVPAAGLITPGVVLLVAMGTVAQLLPLRATGERVVARLSGWRPVPVGALAAAALIVLVVVLPNLGTPSFIYFQF